MVAAAVGSAASGAGAALSGASSHRSAGGAGSTKATLSADTVGPETDGSFLSAAQQATLGAAVARLVPASGPGDWSAADLGVVDYIDNLLSGFGRDPATGGIYPGGPYRGPSSGGGGFSQFRPLTAAKTWAGAGRSSPGRTSTHPGWPASTRRPAATSLRRRESSRT